MHVKQQQLLALIDSDPNIGSYSLRAIADKIGVSDKPQIVKYHLSQLEKAGLIQMNLAEGVLKRVRKGFTKTTLNSVYSLPVVGTANCGPATIFADSNVQQYLKVSSSLLPYNKSDLYALIADGNSMNKAEIDGKKIESGDFLLVDSSYKNYKNGDVVVAVIDGMATIKRYHEDKPHQRIVLKADSTEKYLPIFIHEGDDFQFSGKVVGIIKG
ncbi:MAG TPA: S24 family peptidase [Candidatus Paceibacterota bacterium]|nr:S24 family peptidase [Candidatus Paceibacterota bacterium]HMO82976.1 S24 family peptidase [Candidatus Paceibacterota bacterium]